MSGVLCRFKENLHCSRRSQDTVLDRFVSLDTSIQVLINHLLPLRPIVLPLQWKMPEQSLYLFYVESCFMSSVSQSDTSSVYMSLNACAG